MSRTTFRWLVVASFAIPILCMVADATVFAHLVPTELKDAMARQTAEELNNLSWGVVASMVGTLAVLLGVPFLIYGQLRFRPWAPKFAIWLSVASYVLMPFFGATVYSGLGSTALSLGSMLWGMVVLLPYASTEVRDYFWPAQQVSKGHRLSSRHEAGND